MVRSPKLGGPQPARASGNHPARLIKNPYPGSSWWILILGKEVSTIFVIQLATKVGILTNY